MSKSNLFISLLFRIDCFFYVFFSVDCSTDKPKQFRWNFHKKTKNSSSVSSQNNASNIKNTADAYSITEEGILRLNELIDFLSQPESK